MRCYAVCSPFAAHAHAEQGSEAQLCGHLAAPVYIPYICRAPFMYKYGQIIS